MVNDIYKTRSCSACISAALNIYSANFTKIFRSTWPWVLAFAMANGLSAFISMPATAKGPGIMLYAAATLVLTAAMFAMDVRIISGVVAMLNEVALKKTAAKVMKTKVLEIAVLFVTGIAITAAIYAMANLGFMQKMPLATAAIVMAAAAIIILLAAAILLSPFIYTATKYLLEPEAKFKDIFGKNYLCGMRRLGFLFSTLVVIILFCFIVSLFLCIPAFITITAGKADELGVISGDASGLPTYFAWLNFVSSAIMAFIVQYMAIWMTLTAFYAYGSIEADNAKRKEETAKKQNANEH